MKQTSKKRTWSLALAMALAAALMAPAAAWAADGKLAIGAQQSTKVSAQATYDTDYTSPTATKKGQVVSDGTFALVSASDKGSLKKVVGVKGNSKGNKANVMLQGQTANKSQKWNINYSRKSKAYVITNARSKKVLAISGKKNGANVFQVKNKKAKNEVTINKNKFNKKQLWDFVATNTGYKIVLKAKSSLVLNVTGDNITVATSNDSAAQRFWLAETTMWKAANVLQNGYYTLRPKGESDVLGLAVNQFVNGTKFKLAKDECELSQAFQLTSLGGNVYRISVVSTGKSLSVLNGYVVQKKTSASSSQKWTATTTSEGVTFKCQGKYLTMSGGYAAVSSTPMVWSVSPTTTEFSQLQLRGLSKANQYGGRSKLSKKFDCYFYLALDISSHQLMVFSRDDTDEVWDLEDQWRCSTMAHDTTQWKLCKKHPNIRTSGAYMYTNDPSKGYSAYYWTHIGYGSWFHSILFRPGSKSKQDSRLGYNISRGCIRNPLAKAKWLQDHLKDTPTGLSRYY